jgi:hypothetical protein
MKANSRAVTLIRLIPVNELAMDFPFPPDERSVTPWEGYHRIRRRPPHEFVIYYFDVSR